MNWTVQWQLLFLRIFLSILKAVCLLAIADSYCFHFNLIIKNIVFKKINYFMVFILGYNFKCKITAVKVWQAK